MKQYFQTDEIIKRECKWATLGRRFRLWWISRVDWYTVNVPIYQRLGTTTTTIKLFFHEEDRFPMKIPMEQTPVERSSAHFRSSMRKCNVHGGLAYEHDSVFLPRSLTHHPRGRRTRSIFSWKCPATRYAAKKRVKGGEGKRNKQKYRK